jgi:hypothetical protein
MKAIVDGQLYIAAAMLDSCDITDSEFMAISKFLHRWRVMNGR